MDESSLDKPLGELIEGFHKLLIIIISFATADGDNDYDVHGGAHRHMQAIHN